MKFLDELIREYASFRDVSAKVARKKEEIRNMKEIKVASNHNRKIEVKVLAFINDMRFMFTDYDEQSDLNDSPENQQLDPEEINNDKKRDEYLKRYQGLIFTNENFCIRA